MTAAQLGTQILQWALGLSTATLGVLVARWVTR